MDKYSEYFSNVEWNKNMTEIRQVASIIRAPLFKDESVEIGERYLIISIKDFPFAGYLPTPQKEIRTHSDNSRIRQYTVQEHDVLLTVVGTIGKVTIVPEHTPKAWVPATNMVCIRFHQDHRENALSLYVYLKSVAGQMYIQNAIHGTSIPIITKGQVAAMRIPAPTPETWEVTEHLWSIEQRLFMEARSLIEKSQSVFSLYAVKPEEETPYSISS